ncbi:class II aldolase [Silicimonas algicola]|uniref:L-fuculose-phosphate aldolase n=1 Tax=Silicimonas algicola TaxID=1826607 RepID=A0A316GE81_9RHOB|nr:class II aldolase/adducin family protein [Silicimonas algicola]AZQ65959.1 class II aldolase [Silicimonas algicola]PWK58246.1 L-fuculose-phosphate aldolase [Silicimonas algicola]
MSDDDLSLRTSIIEACLEMTASGLTTGTSGNLSVRSGRDMLITPSATPYLSMTPDMIARMPLAGDGAWTGPRPPSTEWRFHLDILNARSEIGAVVHAHPTHATALAVARMEIPACHYMVAAFGGSTVRCAGYARYGSADLSALVLDALRDRTACLLANHGAIALGDTLDKAMWRMTELETLARQFVVARQAGEPVILSDAEIAETLAAFADYGLKS